MRPSKNAVLQKSHYMESGETDGASPLMSIFWRQKAVLLTMFIIDCFVKNKKPPFTKRFKF